MHWSYCHIADFSKEDLQQAYRQLSPSRKEYIQQLRRQEDQTRSLAAELLAYRLLRQHYSVTTAQLHRRANGQPYFTGCDLHVSISHCDDLVACAISRDPVGIDIERIRPIKPSLLRYVCTAEEYAYLQGSCHETDEALCQNPDAQRCFFEIWTAKEACFKKHGTGITDFKSVNILPLPRQIHNIEDYILQII